MNLQAMIDSQPPNARLDLQPGELFGQVTIDRPITIVGKGKSTWVGSRTSPTIKITVPGVTLQNLMVEIISDTEAIAIDAAPGTDPVLQDVTLRGDTIGIAVGNIHSTETRSEESSADISFLPPPPMNSNLSGQYHQVPTSAPSQAQVGVSPIDQKIPALLEEAERAENRRDWPTAVDVYEDILILDPRRSDVKRLLKRARKRAKMMQANVQFPPSRVSPPVSRPGGWPVRGTTILAAKDRVVSFMQQSKKFFIVVAVVILVVLALFAARTGINVLERKLETFVEKKQTASLPTVSDKKGKSSNEIEDLFERAADGDAKAQIKWGKMRYFGIGMAVIYTQAILFFRLAAEQGDAEGQFWLGFMYEEGKGVPKDLDEAKKWYRKAARQGHFAAKMALRRQ